MSEILREGGEEIGFECVCAADVREGAVAEGAEGGGEAGVNACEGGDPEMECIC